MTDLDRRTVLRGAAVTGAIGVYPLLVACGSDGSEPGTAESGDAGSGGTTSGSSPSPGPSTTAETEALASTSDIPVGGGKVFVEQEVVVTQPAQGEFVGYSSTCTHQGCTVGAVSDGTINCPCHGSMFSIEDGSVTGGPAQEPLPKKPLTVEGQQIRLA